MRPFTTVFLALPAIILTAMAAHAQDADAARGRTLFQRQCVACHQVAQPRNGVGPHLQGIADRAAGSIPGFNFSPALKGAGVTWTAETLDRYLANPVGMVPGTRMVLRVPNEQDRKDIAAFLTTP
jgi:cytochrome c